MTPLYNRYIPQPDGSFRRSHIPDAPTPPPPPQSRSAPRQSMENAVPDRTPEQETSNPKQEDFSKRPPCQRGRQRSQPSVPYAPQRSRQSQRSSRQETVLDHDDNNVGNFLKNLLPKDFDTGDLLVVLLLLLMSGDCKEDQNSALLTLVLYLFM